MRVLITGASGSGTSTLGAMLAACCSWSFVDLDDCYWLPTNPPFQQKREPAERLNLLLELLVGGDGAVLSGSLMQWGREVEDSFALIVFLTVPASLRVERLRARELARLGRIDQPFLDWAAQYEEGAQPGRNRRRHEAWLSERSCPILRIDGDLTNADRLQSILETLATRRQLPVLPISVQKS